MERNDMRDILREIADNPEKYISTEINQSVQGQWRVPLIGLFWDSLRDPMQFQIMPLLMPAIYRVLQKLDGEPYTSSIVRYKKDGTRQPLSFCNYKLIGIPLWLHSLLVACQIIEAEVQNGIRMGLKNNNCIRGSLFSVLLFCGLSHDLGKLDSCLKYHIWLDGLESLGLSGTSFRKRHARYSSYLLEEMLEPNATIYKWSEIRERIIHSVSIHHNSAENLVKNSEYVAIAIKIADERSRGNESRVASLQDCMQRIRSAESTCFQSWENQI
jgi:hypothetical protein